MPIIPTSIWHCAKDLSTMWQEKQRVYGLGRRKKLALLTDNMILYTENPRIYSQITRTDWVPQGYKKQK